MSEKQQALLFGPVLHGDNLDEVEVAELWRWQDALSECRSELAECQEDNRWALYEAWHSKDALAKGEECDLIAENPDVAGVVQAMTGAAAMHVKAWKGGPR